MDFLPLKTVYTCAKGTSTSLSELAFSYRKLTLDRTFVRHRFGSSNRTPFTQISIVPCDTNYLTDTHRWDVFEGRASLLSRIHATLKSVISECWNPSLPHAILHSSGFDSRCLSWVIRELYHERGDSWLGDTVFLCSKWESTSFKDIMKHEGWQPHQHFVPYEDARDDRYYTNQLMDFRNAWTWSDGASSIGVNLFWYPVVAAVESGLLPNDGIQTFTGQWGNTVFDYGSSKRGKAKLQEVVCQFYNSVLGQRPMYGGEIIHPYAAIPLAKVVCESSLTLDQRLRPFLCEYLDEGLPQFPNMDSDGDRHRRIADLIWDSIMSSYRSSWYGREVHPGVTPAHKTTEFQPFWYHWTLASFCEELRSRGIKVE